VLTGKGPGWGGARGRAEATGYGVVFFLREMLISRGDDLDGATALVSGSGNVAIHAIEKVHEFGGRVIACSDSGGYIVDEKGIDLDVLRQLKLVERGRLSGYADRVSHAEYVPGTGSFWQVPCTIAIPAATQNELTAADAVTLVRNGCTAVAEGANMPTTPGGVRAFLDAGVAFAPGKAANAGGVATSALEMQQNASRAQWTFEQTEARLAEIMSDIHGRCHAAAQEYGSPGNYVVGANIAGFLEVANATLDLGLI
jgi:glutamate dehydrogenase (NADP+)